MNVRATLAALLLAAAPLTHAHAQFDIKVSYSNYTAFGALVTVDVRNTQPSNASTLQVINEFRLIVDGGSCFVTFPCKWGPKSIGVVGPAGLTPFKDAQGNTFTQSLASWNVDLAFGNILGFGTQADNLGVIGCVDPRYISNAWGKYFHYTAQTCAEQGQTGSFRFSTFLTVQNELGQGFSPSAIKDGFVTVGINTQSINLVTPEPATYALMLTGLAVLGVAARRKIWT